MAFAPRGGYVAGGTIYPARFVTLSTSANFTVLQSTTGELPHGISDSQGGVSFPTGSAIALAASGDTLGVWTTGNKTYLELGGNVTAGDYLKPDTNGAGVTGTLGTDQVGAQALESGASGDWIFVDVFRSR